MKIISIGSDPEFFVLDNKGMPYPATPFTEGTKTNPIPIESLGKGFFEQRDNLSFEGNIPPAYSKEEFVEYVTALREYFKTKVAKFNYSISPNGVEIFPKRMLDTPEACEFGCSQVVSSWDSNGLSIMEIPTPVLTGLKYRVSGFHIHIGYQLDASETNLGKVAWAILMGRLFDIFLTVPSHQIKSEPERLYNYGKYGMIRIKDYGVECRTLSTYFTQKEYLPWVWDQIMKIESFINSLSKDDIKYLVKDSYMIAHRESLMKAFAYIFYEFKNKEVLKTFEETKNINIYENINKKSYNYRGNYTFGTTSTSTSTTLTSW